MPLSQSRTFRALRHRNFRLFFIGQGLSNMGTWLQQVAMGWLTYRITGSAWLLGVIAFCANIGILVLGPFSGVLADRINRRHGLFVTQTLLLVQALALAVLVALGHVETWHLIVFALWLGIVQAFDIPLRQSLYVHLVDDRADLANAIALNSFLVNSARVVGPALAGVLLSLVGEAPCFAFNALSFVAVIAALSRLDWPAQTHAHAKAGWWASWVEGAGYALGYAPSRALLIVAGVISWTITPYSSLMPIYAKDVYAGGPHTLGLLLSAAGAGALASTIYLAGRETVRGLGRVIAAAMGCAGLALSLFAYLRVLPMALVLMAVVGGGVILAAASANTILQTIVDDRLRGRASAFFTMAFLGMAPLGNLVAGAMANAWGAPATFMLNGALCIVAALWFRWRLPVLGPLLRPVYKRLGIIRDET